MSERRANLSLSERAVLKAARAVTAYDGKQPAVSKAELRNELAKLAAAAAVLAAIIWAVVR